ncbi:DUF11 domain-containing protein [Sphingomonas sp. CARO-RG-8B-R24-01]|uniref:DUF11 domain-containing protein n=1 Tax=Sphingomonas sp. CARO-RG-8B-R24-01 TaxID=2914831 RepID=UPI001F55CD63|nr:DUF11 domain-containing protein [Sphingomonas sp. CARO-RG-8B-R24-01]
MSRFRHLAHFGALLGLAAAIPGMAADVTRIANTATLGFDASSGRQSISSNTVTLDVNRTKRPTTLSFRLLPVGYQLTGLKCETSPQKFTPAPIDAAALATAPRLAALDTSEPLILVLDNAGGNHDPNVRELSHITVTTPTTTGTIELLETGPDTGVFAGGVPEKGGGSPEIAPCDVTRGRGANFTLSFQEDDFSLASSASVLVDPAGYVFDSGTGALVDGATVALLDDADQPAVVYGDDGTSRYPSTVVSGTQATDASGRNYTFTQGNYRFPFVAQGNYHLRITPPGAYTAPSTRSLADLTALRDPTGLPFILNDASFGKRFTIDTPKPFFSDIPLDRAGQSALLIAKTASVREASPGDFVQYLVSVTNRGSDTARNVHLTDILPNGLRYERGSTRGASEAVPSADGRNLDFAVPAIPVGQRVDIRYVVSVAPGAPTGEALNRVLAAGSAGATSNEAAASVRITPLLFTSGFTLIGRVTEGGCGDPDSGRIGLRGIRLMLEDGTFVVTDKDGYYHVEGIRPGRHVVQLDTNSLPASHEPVACDSDTRTAGSAISRFVEAQGGLLKRVDFQLRPTGVKAAVADALPIAVASDSIAAGDRDWFAGQTAGTEILFPAADTNPRAPVTRVVVKHAPGQRVALSVNGQLAEALAFDTTETNPARTIALSRWSGIGLKDGDNRIVARVLDANGAVVTTLERIVHSSTAAVRATYAADKSRLTADGLTRPLIAVRVTDAAGRPVRDGTVIPFTVDQPYTAAVDAELAQRRPLEGRGRASATARVTGDDGLAFIALEPTTQAGAVHLSVALAEDKQVRTSDIRAWLSGAARDWMIVGFGAGTLGYDTLRTHTSTLPRGMRGGMVQDGQIAFYAKGRIKGSWLATIAYDSARTIDRTRGLLGTIDPDRYYTVYGDGAQQAYDAATQRKLYLRLERRNLYALLGDFETGLTDTQLTRYSRTLNGVKAEYQGNRILFSAFAADTDQLYGRDEIQGNGLSGPYRLSGRDIVPNSDKLRIETRDRLRPELILSTRQLTRHIDYDIDTSAGTIRFREPVLGRDASNNPVFIVVDYETEGATRKLAAGGRAAVRLARGRAQLGASLLRDETIGRATVAGLDLKAKPTGNTEIRAEYATGGKLGIGTGKAWLGEGEIHTRRADLLVYARSQDRSFGLGQQNVVDAGTRKVGIDGRVALADRLALTLTAWNATQLDAPGSRNAAETRLEYRRVRGTLFVGGTYADDTGIDGKARHSRLLTLGGTQDLLGGTLTIGAQAQVAPGGDKESVDFPLRQQVTAALRISKSVRLLAGYEISQGKAFTANTARVGFDVAPWSGAKLMSTINQQAANQIGNTATTGGENGQRTYAQYGLNQSLQLSKRWNLDLTLDANSTLRGKVPTGALVNAFASTANTPIAGQYGNDGDYVAATVGGGYRAERWSWNGRLEYRRSDQSNRWTINSDVLRALGAGRTLAASVRYSDLTDKKGARASFGTADLALALRPQDSHWSLLERLQARNEHADAGITDGNVIGVPAYGAGFQATLRLINNLAVNYRSGPEGAGHGFEATVYYGAKWVRGSFGTDDYTGYIDVLGFDLRRDLGRRFDVGVQGSVQHAWDRGSIAFSGGPAAGVSPAQNVWISVGYNIAGYRDRDFEADRYTRSGFYVTARLKFDQWSLGRAGRAIFGGAK